MNDLIEIRLGGSFLLNAGILGFIRLLEHCGFEEDEGYFIEGQTLKIPRGFFTDNDVAALYIRTMTEYFAERTKFCLALARRHRAEALAGKSDPTKEEVKELADIYKEFAAMIEKPSFKSGYVILSQTEGAQTVSEEMIAAFKKEKDANQKLKLYQTLCDILNEPKVKEVLIFKELMYSVINLYYENTSFFLRENIKRDVHALYRKDFIEPLTESFDESKKRAKRCIECGQLVHNTRSIAFMIDTTDDVARKKSYYWNMQPDAFVCPLCAFLYTLVPLGFAFMGQDAVFINNNASVANLIGFMNAVKDGADTGEPARVRVYKAFTSEKIAALKHRFENVQVIFKGRGAKHYTLSIIGKDIIEGLRIGKKQLSYLEKKYVKNGDDYINVYENVFDNIVNRRNQYGLINRLLRLEFADRSLNYLKNILELQVIFNGGEKVEEIMKYVNWAFKEGKIMRNNITKDIKIIDNKNIDNHLRSYIYKLLNYVVTSNVGGYMDTVIRIYEGREIPPIFKEMYRSDDLFKTIGQSYILGLKSPDEKENNKGDDDNE